MANKGGEILQRERPLALLLRLINDSCSRKRHISAPSVVSGQKQPADGSTAGQATIAGSTLVAVQRCLTLDSQRGDGQLIAVQDLQIMDRQEIIRLRK